MPEERAPHRSMAAVIHVDAPTTETKPRVSKPPRASASASVQTADPPTPVAGPSLPIVAPPPPTVPRVQHNVSTQITTISQPQSDARAPPPSRPLPAPNPRISSLDGSGADRMQVPVSTASVQTNTSAAMTHEEPLGVVHMADAGTSTDNLQPTTVNRSAPHVIRATIIPTSSTHPPKDQRDCASPGRDMRLPDELLVPGRVTAPTLAHRASTVAFGTMATSTPAELQVRSRLDLPKPTDVYRMRTVCQHTHPAVGDGVDNLGPSEVWVPSHCPWCSRGSSTDAIRTQVQTQVQLGTLQRLRAMGGSTTQAPP